MRGLLVECGSEQLSPFDLKYGKATAREVVRVADCNTFRKQSRTKKEARHLCRFVQIVIGHCKRECGAHVVGLSLGCAWQRVP